MKPKIVIGVLVIVAALVYLIIGGFKDNTVYYLTVPELNARTRTQATEGLRIGGYVVPQTIQWDAENITLRFAMAEGADTLHVLYKGVMPDQLAEAQQVVVEGNMGADGTLTASRILLKCPSKYEEKQAQNQRY